ncbi:MAG: ornithine--oxo-acid transaminase, partial [Bacteroidetes bacterium]|nr:ornithine--oxo-acid transaminase [Bacteroidota bacterium]
FMSNGLLAKPTHYHVIRLAPPLCITKEQIDDSVRIIRKSFEELE